MATILLIIFAIALLVIAIQFVAILVQAVRRAGIGFWRRGLPRLRRFTLRDLFLFVTLFAMWCSMVAVGMSAMVRGEHRWPEFAATTAIWVVFLGLYVRWRSGVAVLIPHLLWPVLFAGLLLLLQYAGEEITWREWWQFLSTACLMSGILSFPLQILLYLGLAGRWPSDGLRWKR